MNGALAAVWLALVVFWCAVLLAGCCYSNAVFGSNQDSWACRGIGSSRPIAADDTPICVGETGCSRCCAQTAGERCHLARGFREPCWCVCR